MKYTILLMALIFSCILILPASAADINDETVNAGDMAADETILENSQTYVELNVNENYGNNDELKATADSEGGVKFSLVMF